MLCREGVCKRTCSSCFVPVMAINKPDFLAGYSLFYESARYRAVFLADIENNRDFTLSPKNLNSPKTRQKKRKLLSKFPLVKWSAVGETRTRTGLLPLPPQSSVSTISPPPLCLFWDCKGTTKKLNSKFFCTFFAKIFTFFVRACF